jgi:hypothetical protein
MMAGELRLAGPRCAGGWRQADLGRSPLQSCPQQHTLPTPKSMQSRQRMTLRAPSSRSTTLAPPSRLSPPPRPSPAGHCPPAQGRRHPTPPPPGPSRHDGRARPLPDVVRVPQGRGGLCVTPRLRVRAQFLMRRPRPAVFLSGRSARSPQTAKAARPQDHHQPFPPPPDPPHTPQASLRGRQTPRRRPAHAWTGGVQMAARAGGGAHPGSPSPMQAQASQNAAV